MEVQLETDDYFRTIEATDIIPVEGGSPTTLANAYNDSLYVINASLGDFVAGTTPPVETFTIERVK